MATGGGFDNRDDLLAQLSGGRETDTRKSEPASRGWFRLAISNFIAIALGASLASFYLDYGGEDSGVLRTTKGQVASLLAEDTVSKVDASPVTDTDTVLDASGFVTSQNSADISPEIAGIVEEISCDVGESVKRGSVLVRLDTTLVRADIAIKEKEYLSALGRVKVEEIALGELERNLTRMASLRNADFVRASDISVAKSDVDKAKAAVEQMRDQAEMVQLELAKLKLLYEKHLVRAPFSGVVAQRNTDFGEYVSPGDSPGGGTPLLRLVDVKGVLVEVDVSEVYISRLDKGQRATVMLDAYPERRYGAKVSRIVPVADKGKGTFKVFLDISGRDEAMAPGMSVKIQFIKKENPLTIRDALEAG